ncbi:lipopolysaccharide biosynthesis protein [Dubosiella newyorkensis]|uniref:lipopolysaccharide biosynthesis protein n=1 Tax=Dubosiella newyorkensis TaxID=1862672 RepID=UPI00272B481C|nr:oligosaccharide flippase family protein [Dubosiella newyorkensis]
MKTNANRVTLLNIISTLLLQGIAFITTPLFTRLLGTTQFGTYSIFNSWVLILTCLMGAGISSSIGTGLYKFKNNYIVFRNSILLSSTLICLLEILIIILLSPFLSRVMGFSSGLVLLVGITAFAHYIVNFAQMAFIYEKKAGSNFILSVSLSIISVLFSVFLIYQVDSNSRYLGRIYGVASIYLLVAIIVWLLLYLKKPTLVKKEYLIYGITVGFPIVFHSLSQQILGQSDRIMMQMFEIATAEIGIYSMFYTLSSVLSTVLGALNNSWCPFYYDDVSEEKWEILDKKCKNYIELFTVLSVGFLLLSREVSYIMADESYWSGLNIIPILALAVYFTFMYQFPVNFEFFYKKTKIIAIGTVGAGIFNIILNTVMIPMWGMYGAAIATALSYLALFFAHYYIVTHMKDHPYHLKIKAFVPGIIGMGIGSILFYVLSPWWYMRWGLGLGLGCFELFRIYKRKSIF